MAAASFDTYLARWNLVSDGAPILTRTSRLLPVRRDGIPAMLKIATEQEERRGNRVMAWWSGEGAAAVLAQDSDALLLERLDDGGALAAMAHSGADDEASRIICTVAAKLHAARAKPKPELVPLTVWFEGLQGAADRHGGILATAQATAQALLESAVDIVVLHGDVHHGNILKSPARGWVAIDPKGLQGERGFDFANIFCNPDDDTATAAGRLWRQLAVVADAARLDRLRLLQWILAYAGLSASWFIEDGAAPDARLALAEIAAAELAALGLAPPLR
jgi:streptomycin 6-kinase